MYEVEKAGRCHPLLRNNFFNSINAVYLIGAPEGKNAEYDQKFLRASQQISNLGFNSIYPLRENTDYSESAKAIVDFDHELADSFISSTTPVEQSFWISYKHIQVLQDIVKRGTSYNLVCEDDVVFHKNFSSLIDKYWDAVPDDFDVVYVGSGYPIKEFWKEENIISPLLWKGAMWCAHCMVISRDGAEKITHELPMHEQVDFFYGRLAWQGKLNCYGFNYCEEELCGMTDYPPIGLAYQMKIQNGELYKKDVGGLLNCGMWDNR